MAQAIWSGSISFGLIGIPVKLYPATKRNDVRFHEVERATGRRVRHRRVVEGADGPAPDEPSYNDADPAADGASPGTTPDDPLEATPEYAASEPSQPVDRRDAADGRGEREISGDDLEKGYDV